jgi:hypothetical protein
VSANWFLVILLCYASLKRQTQRTTNMTRDQLQALKIAYTFMPQSIEVNKYEYGDDYKRVLEQIEFVRAILFELEIDPDEIGGEINPGTTPNSCY